MPLNVGIFLYGTLVRDHINPHAKFEPPTSNSCEDITKIQKWGLETPIRGHARG